MKFSLSAGLIVVQLILFVFQFVGVITWPWYILLIPIWVIAGGWLLVFLFVLGLIAICGISAEGILEMTKKIEDDKDKK